MAIPHTKDKQMIDLSVLVILLRYTGENIALFSGGLFAGATIYISLTECPPRTSLHPHDLLVLARSIAGRTNMLLSVLAATTALTAILAAVTGSGTAWVVGGATHVLIVAYLASDVRRIDTELRNLDTTDPDSEILSSQLLRKRALQFGVLGLAGLFAQYLFIVSK